MLSLFLSASVPLPNRHPRWMETADVIAIRDAIKALVETVLSESELVFGGHPAITPLIALLLRSMPANFRRRVVLYQSQWFEAEFVKDNAEFIDFRLVPAGPSLDSSVDRMREEMLKSKPFDAAFFIGGMEGIGAEYSAFHHLHPSALCFPIASTGAAALELYRDLKIDRPDLMHELTYPTLFKRLLNEVKYRPRTK